MKILIQSIMFIAVVSIFAITSDRLNKIDKVGSGQPTTPTVMIQSGMSDEEFLDQMIKHHEEAISMSQKILLPTDRKEIHEMATSIIQNQSKEIETMKGWLKEWYGK